MLAPCALEKRAWEVAAGFRRAGDDHSDRCPSRMPLSLDWSAAGLP
jgi:hypothetical protein